MPLQNMPLSLLSFPTKPQHRDQTPYLRPQLDNRPYPQMGVRSLECSLRQDQTLVSSNNLCQVLLPPPLRGLVDSCLSWPDPKKTRPLLTRSGSKSWIQLWTTAQCDCNYFLSIIFSTLSAELCPFNIGANHADHTLVNNDTSRRRRGC